MLAEQTGDLFFDLIVAVALDAAKVGVTSPLDGYPMPLALRFRFTASLSRGPCWQESSVKGRFKGFPRRSTQLTEIFFPRI
jgi:hypothetical protein